MEHIGTSLYLLPFDPTKVFVLTVASELIMTRSGKVQKWAEQTLDLRLQLSEHLICMLIMASFSHSASIFQRTALTSILHFLLLPISALSGTTHFDVLKTLYSCIWPNESIHPVRS
jgi:hypothetical protein